MLREKKLNEYIGSIAQIGGIKEYELKSGKSKGVSAIDVNLGHGLRFTVLPDRGMDIAWCDYKGVPISYISKTGIVSPEYFEPTGLGFLKGFYCGLLTTCGMTYMGAPCKDGEEELGLHGKISNIPATEVHATGEWIDKNYVMRVGGKVTESSVFGPNVTLKREYTSVLGDKKILMKDEIENNGFKKEPFMLLYHFNLGYPLLNENSILYTSSSEVFPRDEEAKKGEKEWNKFQKPTLDYREQVFYHTINTKKTNYGCLYNPKLELGVYIKFNNEYLNNLIQWKMMGKGEYVLGIEPGTANVDGRDKVRQSGKLQYIEPQETKTVEIEIGIIEGKEELEKLIYGE